MNSFWKDVRYALRTMRKNPAFTAVIALSLGLGIGANVSIFTLVNAVFLKPLPVTNPAELVSLYTTDLHNPGLFQVSWQNFQDYRDKNDVFSGIAGIHGAAIALRTDAQPQQINGELVSGNYFEVLGVQAAFGRTFSPAEDRARGANPVAVLSDAFWRRQFGANPGVLGQTMILNGHPFTVIGVMRPNFQGTNAFAGPALWAPLSMYQQLSNYAKVFDSRRFLSLNVVGRLKPGVGPQAAQAGLQSLSRELEKEYPDDNQGRSIKTRPLTDSLLDPNGRHVIVTAGQLLMTVVGLVLLIACANIANLLLVRSAGRRKEIAVRLSMGASSGRLIQQLLIESMLLSLLGGIAGLAIAAWGRSVLWSFRPPFLREGDLNLDMDPHVLLFALGISLITGLLFGLVPALQSRRPDLVAELKERSSTKSTHGPGFFRLRNLLVVSQVAFSLVALVGAGLFLRSMQRAQETDPGFAAKKLGVMVVNPGGQGYTQERSQIYYRQVLERVRSTPGVSAVSMASTVPLGFGGFLQSIYLDGQEATPGNRGVLVFTNSIEPRYFETMEIPVLRGRGFLDSDREGSRPVAVINETMAKKFWPGQDAIGKRFRFHLNKYATEVLGIVKDNKYFNISEDPTPCVFQPELQFPSADMTLVFRSTGDPGRMIGTVREQVQSIDRDLLITNVFTMSNLIDQSLWAQRVAAGLLAVFGLLALVLSAVGMYGVMAYSVTQRTSEIGIRMALGARNTDVFRLVLGHGMLLVSCGLVIGLGVAFSLSRLIAGLLFGVSPADLATFASTSILLSAVAVLAILLPARRATGIDPLIALRTE